MIEINEKEKCSGCGVCKNICPKKAIYMQKDVDGFLYPTVDKEKCIHCNLCEKMCHMLNNREKTTMYHARYYAACLKNKEDMLNVSSGGAFWALAQEIIQRQGVVYGAKQVDVYQVCHGRATTLQECLAFRRSKYLESNLGKIFQNVRQDLEEKRIVLFSGTGCQIGALNCFLGKSYESLYTCEIVCHGVPSPQMYQLYIKEIEEQNHSKVKKINFRDKSEGWLHNQIEIIFDNGNFIKSKSGEHLFHGAYIRGYFNRPSCSACQYARIPRVGDITLADFWKYRGSLYQENRRRGISLVICSTEKGTKLFEETRKFLDIQEVSRELAEKSCYHLIHSPKANKKKNEFIEMVQQCGYLQAAQSFLKKNTLKKFKDWVWELYTLRMR